MSEGALGAGHRQWEGRFAVAVPTMREFQCFGTIASKTCHGRRNGLRPVPEPTGRKTAIRKNKGTVGRTCLLSFTSRWKTASAPGGRALVTTFQHRQSGARRGGISTGSITESYECSGPIFFPWPRAFTGRTSPRLRG